LSFTSEFFQINGIKSTDIGVDGCFLIRTESEISYPLMGEKTIINEKKRNRDIPYHYGVEKNPIEFDLKFSLLDKDFDENRLYEIGKIFAKDEFLEFRSCDFVSKIFYVICTSLRLVTFGTYKGWVEAHMVNIAPYAFSEKIIIDKDFSDITTPTVFEIENSSNVTNSDGTDYYYPELYIEMSGNTSITLKNLTDSGRETTFTNINPAETIYIDNQNEIIKSSLGESTYRLSNFNKNWFRLIYGKNQISCNNPCILKFICQYPIYI
jgi:phage-related protein